MTFNKSGNVLTVSAEKPISEAVTVVGSKNGTTHAGVVVWGDGVWGSATGIQDVVTYSASVRDPVTAYLKIKTAAIPGRITVKKVDAEGAPLSGIRFLLESSADQVNWQDVSTVETGAGGSVCWEDLTADGGTYYRVTEVQAAGGMTLLTEPLFLGTLDANDRDIYHYRLQQRGLCAALYGRGGIHNLYSACGTHARHGCRHKCLFLQKNHDEKGELNHEENETTLGAAPGHGYGLGAYHHGVRGADH